jgi:hypothetical protein
MPISKEMQERLSNLSTKDLVELNQFIVPLIKAKHKVDSLSAASTFSVGDLVRTSLTVTPKKYAGIVGKVVRIDKTKVAIEYNHPFGIIPKTITCPASSLSRIYT